MSIEWITVLMFGGMIALLLLGLPLAFVTGFIGVATDSSSSSCASLGCKFITKQYLQICSKRNLCHVGTMRSFRDGSRSPTNIWGT